MAESLSQHHEELSNRRLVYEAFVTALRQMSYHRDAHYVHGTTTEGIAFKIDDYLWFNLFSVKDAAGLDGATARQAILDSRRPIIGIHSGSDVQGYSTYVMVYPEDLRPSEEPTWGIAPAARNLMPKDWPANEPFIYQIVGPPRGEDGVAPRTEYRTIQEPFLEPDLAAIYTATVSRL